MNRFHTPIPRFVQSARELTTGSRGGSVHRFALLSNNFPCVLHSALAFTISANGGSVRVSVTISYPFPTLLQPAKASRVSCMEMYTASLYPFPCVLQSAISFTISAKGLLGGSVHLFVVYPLPCMFAAVCDCIDNISQRICAPV